MTGHPPSPLPPTEADPADPPLHWIGFGASAGGLEALTHCIAHLPAGLGCVYVIAQHMSPSHRSLMAEILGRETALTVREAQAGELPRADHVYIVPPGQNLVIRDGCFALIATSPEISPKPSINLFFQSLAENFGDRAIGAVLSGTGADGTSGLLAIKAAGGITLAQTPETAKYDGMPRSAIGAGVVDRILDPSEIGPELERMIRFAGEMPQIEHWDERPGELARIFDLVTARTRIDFSGYKMSTVLRRLQRRLIATATPCLSDYLAHCETHPEELDALARETLISVTEFFRDGEAFRALSARIAELVGRKPEGEECRVWVVGCATGEEAYSIAMLFAEAMGERIGKRLLQIFATDIDEDALAAARRAVYPQAALSELPHDLVSRYFIPVENGMQVIRELRECVTFARQNLIADPPFLRLDLVTCRNVLIYFTPELQARALATLHFGLREEGILFLGRSENANHPDELFTPVDRRNRLFRRRQGGRRADIAQVMRGTLGKGLLRTDNRRESGVDRRFLEAVASCHATRAFLVDAGFNILYSRGEITPFIDLPQGTPQMNLAQIITPELRSELVGTLGRARRQKRSLSSRRRRIARLPGNSWQLTVHPVPA